LKGQSGQAVLLIQALIFSAKVAIIQAPPIAALVQQVAFEVWAGY